VNLAAQEWWTEADAAELDLLVHELVRVAWTHPDHVPPREAVEAVLEWRDGRVLRSKAAWLRIRQQAKEDLAA
jgi:hypothetical protein